MPDTEPVEAQEFVLRLVHQRFYKVGEPMPVQLEAFRPLDNREPEGISVFREMFLDAPEQALLAVPEPKRDSYYIARISVADLAILGLSVSPDPSEPVPGHAVIPELNSVSYPQEKLRCKQVQKSLAELASRDIVFRRR